jgi:hypothetical protein
MQEIFSKIKEVTLKNGIKVRFAPINDPQEQFYLEFKFNTGKIIRR